MFSGTYLIDNPVDNLPCMTKRSPWKRLCETFRGVLHSNFVASFLRGLTITVQDIMNVAELLAFQGLI